MKNDISGPWCYVSFHIYISFSHLALPFVSQFLKRTDATSPSFPGRYSILLWKYSFLHGEKQDIFELRFTETFLTTFFH